MKTIFLFIFLLIPVISYEQTRIGFTESEIRNEMSDKKFERGVAVDGIKFISYKNETLKWVYYFNESGYCDLTMLLPLYSKGYLSLIEQFNKDYVTISDTEWKVYSKGNVIKVNLIYDKVKNLYYFLYQ